MPSSNSARNHVIHHASLQRTPSQVDRNDRATHSSTEVGGKVQDQPCHVLRRREIIPPDRGINMKFVYRPRPMSGSFQKGALYLTCACGMPPYLSSSGRKSLLCSC